MRGKDMDTLQTVHDARITPAYAGKSCWCAGRSAVGGDHPRVCGEKGQLVFDAIQREGSPPRMRGKGVKARYERVAVGITPAYAGKS